MNKIILICFCFFIGNSCFGQDSLFLHRPQNAFIGGEASLNSFFYENIKYPNDARESCITGKVYVSFDVDSLGNVDNVKGIYGGNSLLVKEVLRVVKSSNGKWIPHYGKNLSGKSTYVMPFTFEIKNSGCQGRDYYYDQGVNQYVLSNFKKAAEFFDQSLTFDYMYSDALLKGGISYLKFNDVEDGCRLLTRLKLIGRSTAETDSLMRQHCK